MISKKQYILSVIVFVAVAAGTFAGGLSLGHRGFVLHPAKFQVLNAQVPSNEVDYSLVGQVLDVLNKNYIDKASLSSKDEQQKMLYGAVSGMVSAVGDPYTTFFDPQEYQNFQTQLSGTFEGIGAEVGTNSAGRAVIVSPLAGSPALKAGLKSGDIIYKVDGTDVSNMSLDDIVTKIRGPKGTQVTVTIIRPSDKNPQAQDFKITRDTISVPSVSYSVKDDNGKKIEYIHLTEFGDDTVNLFKQAAADAQKNNVSGIVLDLRGNPGGYLQDAVSVGSYWIDQGKVIVTEAHSDGTQNQYSAQGGNTLSKIPTVVLVDGGTASAAEILSGALRDYGFAKLIGVKTFGKGSVQQLINLPGSTAVKVTVAKWLTPKGQNLNHNGLDPDYNVTEDGSQVGTDNDPQMAKALDLLK